MQVEVPPRRASPFFSGVVEQHPTPNFVILDMNKVEVDL
jgi:hypothetical protein